MQRELSEDVTVTVAFLEGLKANQHMGNVLGLEHAIATLQACWGYVPRPSAPSGGAIDPADDE